LRWLPDVLRAAVGGRRLGGLPGGWLVPDHRLLHRRQPRLPGPYRKPESPRPAV